MTDRFALVPASYVYLLRDGDDCTEVLLQQRGPVPYMAGHWAAAAAGHVEPGETAYDAAQREAIEELGITDLDLDFVLTMQRSQFGPAVEERVDWFFTARSWTGEPRIVEHQTVRRLPHEIGGADLVDLRKAAEFLSAHLPIASLDLADRWTMEVHHLGYLALTEARQSPRLAKAVGDCLTLLNFVHDHAACCLGCFKRALLQMSAADSSMLFSGVWPSPPKM